MKFDGNALDCNNWFELYQTSIGKNPRISPMQKITYLQTLFTGSAKILLESYGADSSQYGQAIEELIRRFGNSKFIVAAYIKQLEDFERANPRNLLSFVRYLNFLRKLVYNFQAKGHTSKLRRKDFCSKRVTEKFSNSKESQWNHFSGNRNPADYATRGINSGSSLLTS